MLMRMMSKDRNTHVNTEEEEYERSVAAEALSDLSRQKRDKDQTKSQETELISSVKNKKAEKAVSKRKKTNGTDEEKTSKKSKGYNKVSKKNSGKGAHKERGSKRLEAGALTTVKQSSLGGSSSLRGWHHPRLLLPKPASGTTVISVPLSLVINQATVLDPANSLIKDSMTIGSSKTSRTSSEKKSAKKSGGIHKCPKCGLKTTTRQALWKHRRRKHPPSPEEKQKFENVKCQECDSFSCRSYKALLIHYNQAHSKKLRIQHRQFSSGKEFEEWKKQTEKVYGAWFVLSNGLKIYEHYSTRYYYCNKSHVSKSKVSRDRKELSKINSKCCAFIIKKEDKETGKVAIEYSLDHVGHATNMGSSVISEDVNSIIASSYSSSVDMQSLMDEISSKVTRSDCSSSETVDRNPHPEIRSVDIPQTLDQTVILTKLVDKLQERRENPVVIYKPKGDVSFEMSSEDFILGLQTPFQRDMMRKHAKEIVCVHVSENNSFVVSLLIIDGCGDAVPIGWLISNKKDPIILRPFLEALRSNCGNFETDILVTNMDSDMYKVWTETFAKPWRKLDCSWHVDEMWREKVLTQVANSEQQLVIYTFLKTLQYEKNEISFRKLMREFLVFLDEVSPGFKQYFSDAFLSDDRCFHWASCFSTGFLSNADKIEDAFHKRVKSVFLASFQNQPVVDFLHVLLKLSHDLAVENFTQKAKNGKSQQIEEEMAKNHQKVDEIQEDQWDMKDGGWVLMSVNEESVECVVQTASENCQCKLTCDICHVCIHMYSCSCIDFLLRIAGCEHIHAVHVISEKDSTPLAVQPLSVPTEEVEAAVVYLTDSTTPIPENPGTNSGESIEQLRSKALEQLKDIKQSLQVTSDLALLTNASDQLRDIAQSFARESH